MDEKIQIMMVEDHPDYRDGVSLALETEKDMELCCTFGTAERALRSLQDMSTRTPDVVLLDLHLPGMNGLEALPWFKKYAPSVKVIILTQSDNQSDVLTAITAGANGYLLKSATLDEISEGIRIVHNGGSSLDPGMASYILNALQSQIPSFESEEILTERELQILTLLSEGLLKKEIADQLGIRVTTVATHIRHIYEKFNVQNAPAAVSKAFRMGIFPAGD